MGGSDEAVNGFSVGFCSIGSEPIFAQPMAKTMSIARNKPNMLFRFMLNIVILLLQFFDISSAFLFDVFLHICRITRKNKTSYLIHAVLTPQEQQYEQPHSNDTNQ